MRPLILLSAVVAFAGCPGSSPDPTPDAGGAERVPDAGAPSDAGPEGDAGAVPTPVCVADTEKLAEAKACQMDEHCPCGAHCTLGSCVYECLDEVEPCADGQRCTLFGRCVQADDPEEIAAPDPAPRGRIRLARTTFGVPDGEVVLALRLTVLDADVDAVRIGDGRAFASSEGVEVRLTEGAEVNCDGTDDGGFAAECTLTDLLEGSRHTVYMRPAAGTGEAMRWEVQLHDPQGLHIIDVKRVIPGPIERPATPVSGIYDGTVQLSDGRGRALLAVPVTAQVIEDGGGLQVRLDDSMKILSPTGELWGRSLDDGFSFHWVRYLGEGGEALGDVDIHTQLHSENQLNRGDGWLGGDFSMRVSGWLPASENLACANAQFMCQGGAGQHPCCGRNSDSVGMFDQAISGAFATLRLFRAGGLPEGAEIYNFGDNDTGSTSPHPDLRERIWSQNSRSPWDQVVQEILNLDPANPVIDSRARSWAALGDSSTSLLRCETDQVATSYSCRGENAGRLGMDLPTCTPQIIAAMVENCDRYSDRSCWNGPQERATRCIHECYDLDLGGAGPGPLTIREYRTRDMELARASICAERFFCYEPPAQGGTFDTESSAMHRRALGFSGDLTCQLPNDENADRIPTAIGLFTNADAEEEGGQVLSAGEMLEACIDDLDRSLPSLQGRGPAWGANDLRAVFRTEGCIDLARFWSSLRWASAPAMFAAIDPAVRDPNWNDSGDPVRANAIYLRLVGQWLQLHQFLGQEGILAHKMARVIRQGDDPAMPTEAPNLSRIRVAFDGAWDLFLRPRYVTGLLGLPAEQLREPDYRRLLYPNHEFQFRGHHEQAVGIPVFLIEAMGSHMAILEAEGEEVWASSNRIARYQGNAAQAVRTSVLIEALAERVAQRAGGDAARWHSRYLKARLQLGGIRGRVLRILKNLDSGGNILGIEDEDLPLYFRPDDGGDVGRFSVISRYFLDEPRGIATQAITSALTALGAARGAWLRLREGTLQDRNHTVEADARAIATAQRYGDPILEICGSHRGFERPGDPNNEAPVRSEEAIDWLGGLESYSSCVLDTERPECVLDRSLLVGAVEPGQLEYQLCLFTLHGRNGERTFFNNLQTDALVQETMAGLGDATAGAGNQAEAIALLRGYLTEKVAGATSAQREGFFDGFHGIDRIDNDWIQWASTVCQPTFPDASLTLPSYQTLAGGPLQTYSCFMGALGEASIEAMEVRKMMEAAQSAIAEHVEAYDITVRSCHYAEQLGNVQGQLMERHSEVMGKLRTARLAATVVATAAGEDWLELNPFKIVQNTVHIAAESTVQVMSDAMDRATANHEMAMAEYEGIYENLICLNDANLHLVGMKTAQINLEAASLGLARAQQRSRGMLTRLDALLEEGRVARERVAGWRTPPVAHDNWLDEDVDGFLNAMRRAKRTAYLAVRAVEYEFQMTFSMRGAVLEAWHPGELEEALADVRTVLSTERINGALPENYRAIFSLKTHLLQLASHEDYPETQYRLNDQQRFRALINSSRFSLFDRDGDYLGQRVPFSLTPFGLQNNDETGFSLPVINAAEDCAERLWGVNISLDGADLLPADAVRQSARVELLQKNSFFTHRCSYDAGESPYQNQTVRPERNLFRDPLAGSPQGTQSPQVSRFPGWTRARVDADLNVEAAVFNAEDYSQNESTELAARGLYGEYAVFFPARMLRSTSADGIDLRKLTDVRIRVDFTSVAAN
jgi:hypothetical protein